jgi:hypothetical protein
MIRVFLSYSHADERYRNELEKHLMALKRQGLIEAWHDRRIAPGEEWANRIDEELRRADIILLLVSIDFINSDYCFELEMKEALARHDRCEAVVIPVILRPCHWTGLPFGKLQAATQDGKPVEKYPSLDDAFLEITKKIEAIAKRLSAQHHGLSAAPSSSSAMSRNIGISQPVSKKPELPRSSNLAIPKAFTDHDKDTFVAEAFNFIANFFEGSLDELQKRNPEITIRFERIDVRSFEAAIYRNGSQVSKCGIWLDNSFGSSRGPSSIGFSYSGVGQRNSYNENMRVEDNGNMLGLQPMGMAIGTGRIQGNDKRPLTNEGAAEYFWSMFFEPVQHR